jgi:hypothetical protein
MKYRLCNQVTDSGLILRLCVLQLYNPFVFYLNAEIGIWKHLGITPHPFFFWHGCKTGLTLKMNCRLSGGDESNTYSYEVGSNWKLEKSA